MPEIIHISIWSTELQTWIFSSNMAGVTEEVYWLVRDYCEQYNPTLVHIDNDWAYVLDDLVPNFVYYVYVNLRRKEPS